LAAARDRRAGVAVAGSTAPGFADPFAALTRLLVGAPQQSPRFGMLGRILQRSVGGVHREHVQDIDRRGNPALIDEALRVLAPTCGSN
jgi:hypothetical protein